ncbi:MAG: TonB-dependent receptor [Bacteroidetes bacterium]|nr:TonB-dependent receptor [Bacteroidota bacterium]
MRKENSYLKYVVSAILFFSIALQISSQNVIKGTIKDAKTKEGLFGVTIAIKGTSTAAITDFDGNFTLKVGDTPLPITVTAYFIGYAQQEITVSSFESPIDIKLKSSEVTLKEVEVAEFRISEKQKQNPLTVESMDVLAIKETPAANFYEGLSHLKGVDMTSASIAFKVINTRGFNSTSPVRSLQIIDGVDNQAPGLNFSLGNFLGAPELDVMKADLIVGASSAFYGPNAFNGVISMTTKNPFQFPGFSASIKAGERDLLEASVRWAQIIKNKAGEDKFAYKLNIFAMRARDWEAYNDSPVYNTDTDKDNPGGYDAVNRYGDENLSVGQNNATSLYEQRNNPGLNRWHRTGYWEKDLVDYNTKNAKASVALHYKLKPETELIYAGNFGTGTTVYQGDNRYSLKDILFFQHRLEVAKKDKYFVRAYTTAEDAGNSYDAVFTSFLLQNQAMDNVTWSTKYRNFWAGAVPGSTPNTEPGGMRGNVQALPGFPVYQWPNPYDFDKANEVMAAYNQSLTLWHSYARDYADKYAGAPRLEPGTPEFEAAFNDIISKRTFKEGGSKFFDRSKLYHVHGEYKLTPKFANITVGANGRMYAPYSEGTIFSDTGGVVIRNYEYGVYSGIEKKFINDKLKMNLTARVDKNQNFNYLFSPAASLVYANTPDNVFRISFSSAVRNPTLQDQYLYYQVGRAILIGNITGYDSLITTESLTTYLNSATPTYDMIEYVSFDKIKPEQVKTIEVGYRGILAKRIFIDLNYYYSFYKNFIGYKLVADVLFNNITQQVAGATFYRIATNASEQVTTQGASAGFSYFFYHKLALMGNYSWNVLNQKSQDPVIPAYNTPVHKFNVGIGARDIITKIRVRDSSFINLDAWGFNINYKWVEGFMFEGSPQFTGYVDTYDLVDAQISYNAKKINTTFKLGASNLLNKMQYQVYGGPLIGRMAYFSILYEPKIK